MPRPRSVVVVVWVRVRMRVRPLSPPGALETAEDESSERVSSANDARTRPEPDHQEDSGFLPSRTGIPRTSAGDNYLDERRWSVTVTVTVTTPPIHRHECAPVARKAPPRIMWHPKRRALAAPLCKDQPLNPYGGRG